MMLATALFVLLQSAPLPIAGGSPTPPATVTASPDSEPVPPDCVHYEDDGRACGLDPQKGLAESACIRAAEHQQRCAQRTTGFAHYAALMRAGSFWGVAGAWLGHRTPRGHFSMENMRRIYVEIASDKNAPRTFAGDARTALRGLYGTDHPTSSTPLLIDRQLK
ncbi:MAG: hypothetical protein QOF71_3498 [Candidatus Eremiobacteraeota bacterium]|jgi:hypothetical protein|nr:hypothetical protein [Candidatus Eremiobacteraeota bacterium]